MLQPYGPTGPSIQAIFIIAEGDQTVAPNADVKFDSQVANTNTAPLTYTFNTLDTITINQTGFYRIDYTITGEGSGAGLAYAILIDGVTQALGTNYGTITVTGGIELKGAGIINVTAPADIILRNIGADLDTLTVTVDTEPIVNATLLIQRVT